MVCGRRTHYVTLNETIVFTNVDCVGQTGILMFGSPSRSLVSGESLIWLLQFNLKRSK
jgi:hypothetical protein